MDYNKVKLWKCKEGMDDDNAKRLRDGHHPQHRSTPVAGKGK